MLPWLFLPHLRKRVAMMKEATFIKALISSLGKV